MKQILIPVFLLSLITCSGQSFSPAPGQAGSTAIHRDSNIIVAWANGIEIQRGYLNLANKPLGFASFGIPENALNHAEGDGMSVVSLGDSGIALVTFLRAIENGPGADFAIFENGFTDNYMEFAFVDVSSDGFNFVRFPAVSETPVSVQLGNADFSDCRYVNNLAGKYRMAYGTPFDLEEVKNMGVDVNNINFIRLTDVVGSIDPLYGSLDNAGNLINDPYPTEFESGGFDLDGIGVIHQKPVGITEIQYETKFYPNPVIDFLHIDLKNPSNLTLHDLNGKMILSKKEFNEGILDLSNLEPGIYFLKLNSAKKTEIYFLVKT